MISPELRPAVVVGLLVAGSLLAGACAGGSDSGTESTTTSEPTATTADPTTTEPSTTEPPTTEPSTTTESTVESTTTTVVVTELAEGSGCTPGEGSLPDGRWFGFVSSTAGGSIDFDLACWYTGAGAVAAAAETGDESPPPNDYFVTNTNDAVRSVPVDPAVNVTYYEEFLTSGSIDNPDVGSFDDWLAYRDTLPTAAHFGVWIDVVGGVVVLIEEQWVP
ncbi:MAG: hypothetical protein ACRBI6_17425 [Acidimicrobiales bacterium]